jgi:hypothetical protein
MATSGRVATLKKYNSSPAGLASRTAWNKGAKNKAYLGERMKLVQAEYNEKIAQIKLESGCVDCGYNAYAVALDFDHLPGFVKLFAISGSASRSWDLVLAEIAKCEVVCSNCHRVRTMKRGYLRPSKEEETCLN